MLHAWHPKTGGAEQQGPMRISAMPRFGEKSSLASLHHLEDGMTCTARVAGLAPLLRPHLPCAEHLLSKLGLRGTLLLSHTW